MFSLRQLDPETKNYVCEDQFFNDATRQIGYESYALAFHRTYHVGTYDFICNLPLVGSHPQARFHVTGEVKCLFTMCFEIGRYRTRSCSTVHLR